jgi:FkbM family methyltransferase
VIGPTSSAAARAELHDRVLAWVRPRTDFERSLIGWVVTDDEYGVTRRRFGATDVIIDVGAHIGVFSVLCHELGSRSIRAFEADPATFDRLREVVAPLEGISADPRAVFRSDDLGAGPPLRASGGIGPNTGASNVMFDGRPFDVHHQLLGDRMRDAPVAGVVALDEVLATVGRVTLLKLDCEGSEYPILLSSRLLRQVDEIVGEYHVIGAEAMEELAPLARLGSLASYRPELLVVGLRSAGFEVTLQPHDATIGWFRAVRAGATRP